MSTQNNKEILAKNLKYYIKKYNVKRRNLCKTLNIPPSSLSDWMNAVSYPRMDKIELISTYFGIEKSDLIEDRLIVEVQMNKYVNETVRDNIAYFMRKNKINSDELFIKVKEATPGIKRDEFDDMLLGRFTSPFYIDVNLPAFAHALNINTYTLVAELDTKLDTLTTKIESLNESNYAKLEDYLNLLLLSQSVGD